MGKSKQARACLTETNTGDLQAETSLPPTPSAPPMLVKETLPPCPERHKNQGEPTARRGNAPTEQEPESLSAGPETPAVPVL